MGTLCHNFITATATLFLIVTAAQLQEVETSGIFEFDLVSFENREGRDILGGCCSGRHRTDGSCLGTCSVYLRICIKHYQTTVDPNSPCTFREFETPLLTLSNSSSTSEDTGFYILQDTSKMLFDLEFTWPGQFSLIVEAWHPSDGQGNNKVLVARFIAQRTIQIGSDWTWDKLSTNRSTLEVKYRVYCSANYYGPKCDHFCRPRDDKFGHYTCREDGQRSCFPGWTGDYCDKAVCLPGCHEHHGTCGAPHECNCRPGWQGQYCDICTRYPGCQHGTCVKPYQCNCDEGWGGLFCDQDLNYCTNHKPCQNGGTCTNTGQGSYTCSCTEEFMGKNCHVLQNPCQKNPCRNNGICKNSNVGEYLCECRPGFYGPHCETSARICTENPCENGGSCIHDPGGFVCACLPGYTGLLCEKSSSAVCKTGHCLNGGTCIDLSSGPRCNCPQGLSGDRCDIIVTCSSNACKNGGTCSEHSGIITCTCAAGFTGSYCQIRQNSCSSKPCANGGVCHDRAEDFYCDCKPGFGGKNCTLQHDHCSSLPCLNGASCHVTPNGFECNCLKGYHGIRCQLKEGSVSVDWNGHPSVASNVSHRVSQQAEPYTKKQVAFIATLSSILPFVVVLCFVIYCILKRRRRHQNADETKRAKECDFDVNEEQLQNERNAMHMNNKQCNMPQKIVNALDRIPAKVTNEAPPKVLNIEVSNKVPDKSLVCTPRTLQKKDNTCSSSLSCHGSPEWPLSNNGGIYVIEDHFRPCPEPGSCLDMEDILATEV